jgi:hypothetical protein
MTRFGTKTRRKSKHVLAAISYLRARGASDIRVTVNKHIKLWFAHPKGDFLVTLTSTPEDEDVAADATRQIIRRLLRKKNRKGQHDG